VLAECRDALARADCATPLIEAAARLDARPLVYHAHLLLALGPRSATLRVSAPNGECSYLKWITSVASSQATDGFPPYLVRAPNGWAISHHDSSVLGSTGEGHAGQLLAYAGFAGIDETSLRLRAPDGSEVLAESLAIGLLGVPLALLDTDYAIPALLFATRRTTWQTRWATEVSLDDLLQEHLRRPLTDRACFAAHWHAALVLVLSGDWIEDDTLASSARKMLKNSVHEVLGGIDGHGAISVAFPSDRSEWRSESPSVNGREFSRQAHVLEWLVRASDDETLLADRRIHSAFKFLHDRLCSDGALLSLLDVAHAASAIREYRTRLLRIVDE